MLPGISLWYARPSPPRSKSSASMRVGTTNAVPLNGDDETGDCTLDTLTVTVAEVVRSPAALRAIAVRLCEPLAAVLVSHETVYGATMTSAPSPAPSTKNCTPATLMLSEAVAEMVIIPDSVVPLIGDVRPTAGAVGGGVAGRALETVTVTAPEVVLRPEALRATAVR